ncbi:MAG: nitrite/sulfite reductase [Bacteroidota bacterium]
MRSFRTEIENPLVEQDIVELARKIELYRHGQVDEDNFRSLRLARGVYGQRQQGVQMIRIKLPYGKLTTAQLRRIAEVSDRYSNGKLHFTTRQDIQIHYVRLEDSPELWAILEKDDVTLREACGNTVRNVTASPLAGVDVDEPFDVTPHAHAAYAYFLRHPVCQDMGRKFKIAYSSSEKDSAFAFMHDLGFIPRIQEVEGTPVHGFKVVMGGGLGAQPKAAATAYEFLPADRVLPFTEAVLRIFDRHGERDKRMKARFKFLLAKLGREEILAQAQAELASLPARIPIATDLPTPTLPEWEAAPGVPSPGEAFATWKATNTFPQKQSGRYAVQIRIPLGNISTATAREIASLARLTAADDLRVTQNQGLMLRHVPEAALPNVYAGLHKLNLAQAGADSTADITACPGTDTCNLGITNSTQLAMELETVIREEYPALLHNQELKLKISGCMNACGQHVIAGIGFHGSTLRAPGKVLVPAVQIMLGGGVPGGGEARYAARVIKLPSRRATQALRRLLNDYTEHGTIGEPYYQYFERQGKAYFYQMLKPLADLATLRPEEFIDWGHAEKYAQAIGVGECAGVVIDLVQTLIDEAAEKLGRGRAALRADDSSVAIYHSYNAMLNAAKALVVSGQGKTNTQATIVTEFTRLYEESGKIQLASPFSDLLYQMRQVPPSPGFAHHYFRSAEQFLTLISNYHQSQDPQHAQAS